MAETDRSPAKQEKRCLVCQATSQERLLLSALENDRPAWVCVRCLPVLIHGGHH